IPCGRRISADSLDWRDGGRLCDGPMDDPGYRTPPPVHDPRGVGCPSVRNPAGHATLRRTEPVERTVRSVLDDPLDAGLSKIPAVPLLSADDTWARLAVPGVVRRWDASLVAAGARVRPGADVLLSAAPAAHPRALCHGPPHPFRPGGVALWRHGRGETAPPSRIRFARRLPGVGRRNSPALSRLPLVRRAEGSVPRKMAKLPLSGCWN